MSDSNNYIAKTGRCMKPIHKRGFGQEFPDAESSHPLKSQGWAYLIFVNFSTPGGPGD